MHFLTCTTLLMLLLCSCTLDGSAFAATYWLAASCWISSVEFNVAGSACKEAQWSSIGLIAAIVCTVRVCCRPGCLTYSYAVAYSVADPVSKAPTPAGRALAAALADADGGSAPRLVLPVLLACSGSAIVTDFSQGKLLT